MRLKIVENIILFFLLFIVLALIYMQVVKGGYYYNLSTNNYIRVVPIEGARGKIFDRNGLLLADNRIAYHVAVVSQGVNDIDGLFHFLGGVLKKDPAALKSQFYRKRRTPFEPVIIAQDVDQRTILTVLEHRLEYPGLLVEKTFQRVYPFSRSDAHTVGYVGKIDPEEALVFQEYGFNIASQIGKSGVEKIYDSILRAQIGGRQIEVNSRGQEVRLLGLKEPEQGKDLQLTIDQRIQSVSQELLDSRPGSIIVMNLDDGKLLGLVSSPSFDPNAFVDRSKQDEMLSYIKDANAPLLNRALSGRYPPGSVFKIPVALAAIELKKITPDVRYDCPGYYMLNKAKFGCAHVHSSEDLFDAIAHSCNVYFYHISQAITAKVIEQYAKAFGLGRVTGIDLPSEAKGQVIGHPAKDKTWYTGNTLNLSIGQGDTLTTPIQLTVMMAAVANNGVILRPYIVQSIGGELIKKPPINKLPKIRLHDNAWETVQKGLRLVITDPEGTAAILNGLTNMTIFGKTGTAQAGTKKENHAWFVGYVKSSKANLAFCVFLEHGGSSINAVELTQQLLSKMQAQGIL